MQCRAAKCAHLFCLEFGSMRANILEAEVGKENKIHRIQINEIRTGIRRSVHSTVHLTVKNALDSVDQRIFYLYTFMSSSPPV